ncbi:Teneurin-3 [Gossypium arboreum]|uniref:Teneurin-3 n=1 Tax=Gossypium arboreum TaxID=29729 RepID=A0A0B0PV61_GOSAR|nr:Teneurin-3 [Gossypium arboreum]
MEDILMISLSSNNTVIALANKILIPGIAARKFPAVDVIYSDGRKSKLAIVFDASGVDASKLAVPEGSLVCLSFRANSQIVHCCKTVIRGISAAPWQWRGYGRFLEQAFL